MPEQPGRLGYANGGACVVVRNKAAVEKAAAWALTCRNKDGGFGHYPGSPCDMDAVYFKTGTLTIAGVLKTVDPLPKDPHLLGWGHLFPQP
jgi:Prenyltransferase and squalene oxidase repeat